MANDKKLVREITPMDGIFRPVVHQHRQESRTCG